MAKSVSFEAHVKVLTPAVTKFVKVKLQYKDTNMFTTIINY